MADIFINYRRADLENKAHTLYHFFARHFGVESVFFDFETPTEFGKPWPPELMQKVKECQFFICVIGSRWEEEFHLERHGDWVKKEIETAIANSKKIVSILVGVDSIPENMFLKQLGDFPWIRLHEGTNWDNLLGDLLKDIENSGIIRKTLPDSIYATIKKRSKEELGKWLTWFTSKFKEGIIDEVIPSFQTGAFNYKSLRVLLSEYKSKTNRHVMMTGKGGCGKSVALAALCKELLEDKEAAIPLFLVLHELNKSSHENPIRAALADKYFEGNYPQAIQALKEHRFVLLLDGYNELDDKTFQFEALQKEFIELFTDDIYPSLQIILSSRLQYHNLDVFTYFTEARVNDLENEVVVELLNKRQFIYNINTIPLLCNPFNLGMRLRLGDVKMEVERTKSQLWREISQNSNTPYYLKQQSEFDRGAVLITGLQNLEIYEASKRDLAKSKNNSLAYYCLLARHIAPRLAWEMRNSQNLYFFDSQNEPMAITERFLKDFAGVSFRKRFASCFPYCEAIIFDIQKLSPAQILKDLTDDLHILSKRSTEGQYEFFHQNLRDYFAALDLVNRVALLVKRYPHKLNTKNIPQDFLTFIDHELRQSIGELLLEHRNVGLLDKDKNWGKSHWNQTPLHQLANSLRGKSDKNLGKTIWNIVIIWMESRNGDLAGENFQELWLSGLNFYHTTISKRGKNGYLAANFTDASMYYNQFLGDDYGNLQSIQTNQEYEELSIYYAKGDQLLLNLKNRTLSYYTTPTIKWKDEHYDYRSQEIKVHSENTKFYLTLQGNIGGVRTRRYLGQTLPTDNTDAYLRFIKENLQDGIIDSTHIIGGVDDYYLQFWSKKLKIELRREVYLGLTEKFVLSPDLKTIVVTDCERGEDPFWEKYGQNQRKFDPIYDKWYLRVINQENNTERKISCDVPSIPVLFHPHLHKIIVVTANKSIAELDLNESSTENLKTLDGLNSFEELPFAYSPDGYSIFTSNLEQKISLIHIESSIRTSTFFNSDIPKRFINMHAFNVDERGNIKSIFTCNDGATIWEWDYESGKSQKVYERFENKRWSSVEAVMNESGTLIWIGTDIGYIREFDLEKKQCTLSIKTCSENIYKIEVYEPEGILIAHSPEHSYVIDLISGKVEHSISLENEFAPIYCHQTNIFYYTCFLNNDTEQVLSYHTGTGQIEMVFEAKISKDLEKYVHVRKFPGKSRAISPGGRYLLIDLFSSGHVLCDLQNNNRNLSIDNRKGFDRAVFLEEDKYLTVKFDYSSFSINIYEICGNTVDLNFTIENNEIDGHFINSFQHLKKINKIVFTITQLRDRNSYGYEYIIFFCLNSKTIEIIKNKVYGSIGIYSIATFTPDGLHGIIEDRDYPFSSLNFIDLKTFSIKPALVKPGEYKYLNNLHCFFQDIGQPNFLDKTPLSWKLLSELRHNGMKLKRMKSWQHHIYYRLNYFDDMVRNMPYKFSAPYKSFLFIVVLFYLLFKHLLFLFFSLVVFGVFLSSIAIFVLYIYGSLLQHYDAKIIKETALKIIAFTILITFWGVLIYGAVKSLIRLWQWGKTKLTPKEVKEKYKYLPARRVGNLNS